MSNLYLCPDVVQKILDFSNVKEQLILTSLSREHYNELKIRKLTDYRITQEIIMQKKFDRLQTLNARNNSKIVDINHLKDVLIELNCDYICGIDQNGISGLK